MSNRLSICGVAAAIFFLGAIWCQIAQSGVLKGNLVIIYDASGSMSLDLDGNSRKEAVNKALSEAVLELPQDINIGLIAFGHQRQGDCDDVSERIPVSSLKQEVFIEEIRRVTPRGMSPISLSLQKAGDVLKPFQKSMNTILLIADGKDGCLHDPCETAAQLKKDNPQIKIHVVGVSVSQADAKQLECIAAEGNGVYFPCQTMESIRSSIRQTFGLPELLGKNTETAAPAPALNTPSDTPTAAVSKMSVDGFSTECAIQGGRVRQTPSLTSPIAAVLNKGDALIVFDTKGDWHHVTLSNGKTGWVYKSILDKKPDDELSITSEKKAEGKVKSLTVDVTPEGEEKVIVTFSDVFLPKTLKINEAVPKLVCDFSGVRPSSTIPLHQQVNGNFLQAVRTGYHPDKTLFRLALDLVPNQLYEINQNFMIKTNQYVIVLKKLE